MRFGAPLFAVVVLFGCGDFMVDPAQRPHQNQSPAKPLMLDDEFAAIESGVPGFAGWYFDSTGAGTILLKDLANANLAESVVLAKASERFQPRGKSSAVAIRKARCRWPCAGRASRAGTADCS